MATTAATLIQRSRRFLGDWPEEDALTASNASNGATITVVDSSIYSPGWILQVDTEAMYVTSLPSGTTVAIRRAVRGSTAASHASGATVLVRPHFLDMEYLDALNSGLASSFPWLYKPVIDETTTTVAGQYQYTVPNLDSVPIPFLSRVKFKESGDTTFRLITDWEVRRGAVPKIQLRRDLPDGILQIQGFGPLPSLASLSASLDTQFPTYAEDALVLYAAQYLLESGEARRVREDTGARDDREAANRTGSSLSAANSLLQRYQLRLRDSGMPPMPKHVKSVI